MTEDSYLPLGAALDLDQDSYMAAPAMRVTGFGEEMGARLQEGWESSLPAQAARAISSNPLTFKSRTVSAWPGAHRKSPDAKPETLKALEGYMGKSGEADPTLAEIWDRYQAGEVTEADALQELHGLAYPDAMSKPKWKESEWYRPGIQYNKDMTPAKAEALAGLWDRRVARELLYQRSPGGFFRGVAGFGAAMVGSLPDPINFIPIAGPLGRLGKVAQFVAKRPIMGRAALGVLEGAAGNAILEVPYAAEQTQAGDTAAWETAVYGIMTGGALGGLLGGAVGAYMKRKGVHAQALSEALMAHLEDEIPDMRRVFQGVPDAEHLDFRPPRPAGGMAADLTDAINRVKDTAPRSIAQTAEALTDELGIPKKGGDTVEEATVGQIAARGELRRTEGADGTVVDEAADWAGANEGINHAERRAGAWERIAACIMGGTT